MSREPNRPSDIETAILYDGPPPAFTIEDLCTTLSIAFRKEGMRFAPGADLGPETMMVHADGFFVALSHGHAPLGPDGFAATLTSPLTGFLAPDAAATIARHRGTICITAAFGPPLLRGLAAERGLAGALPPITDEQFRTTQRIARMAVSWILKAKRFAEQPATLVHWCPSNVLATPESFTRLVAEYPEAALLYHPCLVRGEPTADGRDTFGLETVGATNLIGREIVVDPAPVSLDHLVERVASAVEYMWTHRGGEPIPHDECIGAEKVATERIRVRHLPPSNGHPNGRLRLTFEFRPQDRYGPDDGNGPTEPDPTPTPRREPAREPLRDDDEAAALNPDDPVDRMILDALKRRREEDARQRADATASEANGGAARAGFGGGAARPSFGRKRR